VVNIDLDSDGPHALVAGTTGSGKSELLRTFLVSAALHHPPSRLQLLLVDYKGGAAFSECARLPHTLGLVTDLDEHLTCRALASLTAELRRRERILAEAGAKDLDTYRSLRGSTPSAEARHRRSALRLSSIGCCSAARQRHSWASVCCAAEPSCTRTGSGA